MLSLYVPGDSFVHGLPAGTKLLILCAAGVACFAALIVKRSYPLIRG